jgi:hypothetical protein
MEAARAHSAPESDDHVKYSFIAKIWKYKGKGGWHFVTLPKALAKKIRRQHGFSEEGWGRLKTDAKTQNSKWRTAVWFDTKLQSYLLPVKASVRKAEKAQQNDKLKVTLIFESDAREFLEHQPNFRKHRG